MTNIIDDMSEIYIKKDAKENELYENYLNLFDKVTEVSRVL